MPTVEYGNSKPLKTPMSPPTVGACELFPGGGIGEGKERSFPVVTFGVADGVNAVQRVGDDAFAIDFDNRDKVADAGYVDAGDGGNRNGGNGFFREENSLQTVSARCPCQVAEIRSFIRGVGFSCEQSFVCISAEGAKTGGQRRGATGAVGRLQADGSFPLDFGFGAKRMEQLAPPQRESDGETENGVDGKRAVSISRRRKSADRGNSSADDDPAGDSKCGGVPGVCEELESPVSGFKTIEKRTKPQLAAAIKAPAARFIRPAVAARATGADTAQMISSMGKDTAVGEAGAAPMSQFRAPESPEFLQLLVSSCAALTSSRTDQARPWSAISAANGVFGTLSPEIAVDDESTGWADAN